MPAHYSAHVGSRGCPLLPNDTTINCYEKLYGEKTYLKDEQVLPGLTGLTPPRAPGTPVHPVHIQSISVGTAGEALLPRDPQKNARQTRRKANCTNSPCGV